MNKMIERILELKDSKDKEAKENLEKELLLKNDARELFLYLYFVSDENLELISQKIMNTKNYRYIHFLLRSFHIKRYDYMIENILKEINNPNYLFNILYDIDYLEDDQRLRIIDKILTLENKNIIYKSIYYYFIILNQYNEELFKKIKVLMKKQEIDICTDNYKIVLDNIQKKENDIKDPKGFSPNCYKNRKIAPTLIVCHCNHTYKGAIKHFYQSEDEVSSHYLIRRDGHIKQIVSLDDAAWANGTSLKQESDVYYKFASSKLIQNHAENANNFSISIEHESFDGQLTELQFQSTIKVMKKIIHYIKEKYNEDFIIDRDHIIGHYEVNPIVRTKCPGNNFPFERIIKELKKDI